MQHDLADRIAAAIGERQAPLTTREIAATYLKLVGAGQPAAGALVRGILAGDERFIEQADGSWGLRRSEKPALLPPVTLCVLDLPPGTQRTPWLWRMRAARWDGLEQTAVHQGPEYTPDLGLLLDWLRSHPVACERPGLLSRWLGAQERIHALPEFEPPVIDLQAWRTMLNEEPPALAAEDESAALHLANLGELCSRIGAAAEERGMRTWAEVAQASQLARQAARRDLWDSAWTFTPDDIAALPEEPGVYRFIAPDGTILYVGKAKNLRRRVASYFRPVAGGTSRRAEFLRSIERLEAECVGTEIEALIREAQLIAEHRPAWNVQVNVAPGAEVPPGEEELLLLVPRAPGGHTLFALGGERVGTARLEKDFEPAELLNAVREFYVEGGGNDCLQEISGPERRLVRRWLRWSRAACGILRLADFSTYAALVGAAERLVRGSDPLGPDDQPQLAREGAGRNTAHCAYLG